MSRLAVLALLLSLLAACAQPEEEAVALDADAAQALAQGAERLSSALADDDACAALAEADAVTSQARDGVESGTVPVDVANEVEAVAGELTSDLTCEPDDGDEAEEEEEEGPDEADEEEGPPDEGDEEEGPPDEGDEPDTSPDGPPQDERGPDDEDGPRGGGPDGEGPPGHAGGPGNGR